MSLDVTLNDDCGNELFEMNITHNLTTMASEAGIYKAIWRPDENGFVVAGDIIDVLLDGFIALAKYPDDFKKFNPENGWGSYEILMKCVAEYIKACRENPKAKISVWR